MVKTSLSTYSHNQANLSLVSRTILVSLQSIIKVYWNAVQDTNTAKNATCIFKINYKDGMLHIESTSIFVEEKIRKIVSYFFKLLHSIKVNRIKKKKSLYLKA